MKKKKDFIKTILLAIVLIGFYLIISDWEHFKAGLFGI